jgi:hypothetical protein
LNFTLAASAAGVSGGACGEHTLDSLVRSLLNFGNYSIFGYYKKPAADVRRRKREDAEHADQ